MLHTMEHQSPRGLSGARPPPPWMHTPPIAVSLGTPGWCRGLSGKSSPKCFHSCDLEALQARKGGSSPLPHTFKPLLRARPHVACVGGARGPPPPRPACRGPINQTPRRSRQQGAPERSRSGVSQAEVRGGPGCKASSLGLQDGGQGAPRHVPHLGEMSQRWDIHTERFTKSLPATLRPHLVLLASPRPDEVGVLLLAPFAGGKV